jgi:hypothetical protein
MSGFAAAATRDLFDFRDKALAVGRTLDAFIGAINGHPVPEAWRDIFQQELTYPLPRSHPLSQTHEEPPDQPQASGP